MVAPLEIGFAQMVFAQMVFAEITLHPKTLLNHEHQIPWTHCCPSENWLRSNWYADFFFPSPPGINFQRGHPRCILLERLMHFSEGPWSSKMLLIYKIPIWNSYIVKSYAQMFFLYKFRTHHNSEKKLTVDKSNAETELSSQSYIGKRCFWVGGQHFFFKLPFSIFACGHELLQQ